MSLNAFAGFVRKDIIVPLFSPMLGAEPQPHGQAMSTGHIHHVIRLATCVGELYAMTINRSEFVWDSKWTSRELERE